MKVKITPVAIEVRDGVSRYARSLAAALEKRGVEVVADGDYDVLHLVAAHFYDQEWRVAKRNGKRLVVTVHDLIPEHFGLTGPQYAGVDGRKEVLSAADAVIAISQYTKNDIISTYGISADKICVIYNGVDDPRDLPLAGENGSRSSSGFLLWVGRRAGYKNFFWFVRSAACLLWGTDWRVICTGGQGFGRKERLLIGLLGLSRRFSVVMADERGMVELYRDAICLVMPSKLEGFGLPIVEAMANECPVVIPREHVFPEVAGDAAAFYERGSASSLRHQIRRCTDPDFRRDLTARGIEQARRYSWARCAEAVVRCYERCISS